MDKKNLIVGMTIISLISAVSIFVYALSISSGTEVAPRLLNAPQYVCSDGQPASECAQLKLTCGNGVTDPNETCQNCAFDSGCSSGLICGNISNGDEYTCHYGAGLCLAGPAG